MESQAITRIFMMSMVVMLLQFHHSLCYLSPCTASTLSCPAANDDTSSNEVDDDSTILMGSGEQQELNHSNNNVAAANPAEHKYVMETSIGLGADSSVIEITLRFANCIPFNPSAMAGPRWFKLEAILNSTGETVGEFTNPPFHTEAELCENNVIAFRTTNPTVLDLPRTYRWKPMSLVREPLCFRATITHYPDNSCETITKCLPSNEVPTPSSDIINNQGSSSWSNVNIVPSPKTINECNRKWNCHDPDTKWRRDNPHCTCNSETNECKQFSMKCEARRELCYFKNILPLKIQKKCTPVEQPSTPPPPTAPPVEGFCEILGSKMTCSSTGDFKLSQCLKDSDTQYSCFCVSYVGVQRVSTEKLITIGTCDSPSTYDLNCIHD